MRHGVPAGISVLLGVVTGALVNLATAGSAPVSIIVGLAVAVVLLVAWEIWRAASAESTGPSPRRRVTQKVGSVGDDATVIGIASSAGGPQDGPGSSEVVQHVSNVSKRSRLIGWLDR